jgi:hypothetical protein
VLDLKKTGEEAPDMSEEVRRDAEPDRAPLLKLLAVTAVVLGVMSLITGLSSLVGLPLGVAVLVMAGRDLRKMFDGVMDVRAREQVEAARKVASAAVAVNLLGFLLGFFYAEALLPRWLP